MITSSSWDKVMTSYTSLIGGYEITEKSDIRDETKTSGSHIDDQNSDG